MKTEHYKEKLEEEKRQLEREMSMIGRRNPAVPNDWEPTPSEIGMEADIADQADVVSDRENSTAILADLETQYDAVLEALSRIEKKTYGVCEVCHGPIEETRLEADPAATTCIKHL
ncbi:MAG: TraR/DksA C4-type zinc finger protein [Patescibacteria group bacterium]